MVLRWWGGAVGVSRVFWVLRDLEPVCVGVFQPCEPRTLLEKHDGNDAENWLKTFADICTGSSGVESGKWFDAK